jgi:transposase
MKTLQFEGVKVALKQDKTGYVLTLSLHPDDIPEELLRDFVGSRYQVVMVRINQNEQPMDRQAEFEGDKAVRIAGMLCKDPKFWKYLYSQEQIFDEDMDDATEWVRSYLNVQSRADLKTNNEARILLERLNREYQAWLQEN